MKDKRWILGLVILVIVIGGLSIWGFKKSNKENEPQVSGQNTTSPQSTESYFSEEASIMYFYSDYCSWCLKEKDVLTKLGSEGYKVKPMNVGKNAQLWTDYKINGTPTFIAKNGDRSEGYKEYGPLKDWLDQHK